MPITPRPRRPLPAKGAVTVEGAVRPGVASLPWLVGRAFAWIPALPFSHRPLGVLADRDMPQFAFETRESPNGCDEHNNFAGANAGVLFPRANAPLA